MRSLTLLSAVVLLAACTTPQEHAARLQAEMEQLMTVYGPACVRLGYQANSNEWRNCILQLATRDDLQRINNYSTYPGGWGPGYWHGGYWGPYW